MLLIDCARDVVGVPCRGLHVGRHVGWTTSPDKAEALRLAGATIRRVGGITPGGRPDHGRIQGFEISFEIDAQASA